jgi:putative phage-type endonuclease
MTLDIEQGSAAWKQIRLGKVTASRVADVIAKTRSGWGASRANYMADLLTERLTGAPAYHYISAEMQHGTDTEPQARVTYELVFDCTVEPAGFVQHPTISAAGASPDGYLGEDGLVEIKAPMTATHIETLLGDTIPAKYILQMQFQMATTGRQWCDFVSFDPRLPASMQLFVKRVQRDQFVINDLERCVIEFLNELDAKERQLTERYGVPLAMAG